MNGLTYHLTIFFSSCACNLGSRPAKMKPIDMNQFYLDANSVDSSYLSKNNTYKYQKTIAFLAARKIL